MKNTEVLLGFLFSPRGSSRIKSTSTNNSRYVEFLGTLFLFVCFQLLTKQAQLIDKAKGHKNLLSTPEQYSFFSNSILCPLVINVQT